MSLPIPTKPWEALSLDFIVEVPPSNGYNTIMVTVDMLTKMAHFVPLKKLPSSKETAQRLLDHVIKLHGVPSRLVSDRGSQFVSKFWKALCHILHIDHGYSSAYRQQTNGQTERVNQCLEQYLRCYCTHLQDNWTTLLPLAEFSYNNATSSSTRYSPFYANYGFHPNILLESPLLTNIPSINDYWSIVMSRT